MSRTYVFTNHKGGVGKSTSATNIAFGISAMLRNAGASNPRVLLIDTDSQAHATLVTTGRNDFDESNSLYTVLMADWQYPKIMECAVVSSCQANRRFIS